MAQHKQIKINIYDHEIEVDEGLEDIILLLNKWDFPTNNSCIDNNGNIWICFDHASDVRLLMQLALKNSIEKNSGFVFGGNQKYEDNLFLFLTNEGKFEIVFNEMCILHPEKEDTVIGTGELEDAVSLRFPKKFLPLFKKYLFEVLQ